MSITCQVMISWQSDKKASSGEKKEACFDLKFTMATTINCETSHNPHNLTAHFLEIHINKPNATLAQFMQVS